MSSTIYLHNRYHLGDGLILLHLVRALAKKNVSRAFVVFTNYCNIPQLVEVVQDLPNILLEPFESELWAQHQHESIDTWKNFHDMWVESPMRWDWSSFQLWHHKVTARRMGFESPFTCREHLLMDYPALDAGKVKPDVVDFLVGDSPPNSGQYSEWADHSKYPLLRLIDALENSGRTVQLTSALKANGLSITAVGQTSLLCRHHIMVPNGPFWCTMNTANHHAHEGRKRIVLLDNGENLNMPGITQCRNVDEVMAIAKTEGWV